MLTHLQLSNFAIVDELDLDLTDRMIALTGETGAGKSILVNAIQLALGDRADLAFIRQGKDKCDISLSFDITKLPEVSDWLSAHELDAEDECFIRRTFNREGRSKGFINNRPVPMQSLRELGEQLVSIHGQHAHQHLTRRNEQRRILDEYGKHQKLVDKLLETWKEWKNLNDRLIARNQDQNNQESQLELLTYQVTELEQAELKENEYTELEREHQTQSTAVERAELANTSIDSLYESDNSLVQALGQVKRQVEQLNKLDPEASTVLELINTGQIQLEEATSALRDYSDRIDSNPERLQWIEERVDLLQTLARKHHTDPENLPALFLEISEQLSSLTQKKQSDDQLDDLLEEALKQYRKEAEKLHKQRIKTAAALSGKITERMQQLGMKGGIFEIQISMSDNEAPSPYGIDEIDFMVSANPGQAVQTLAKVASGGELSRISLAIQVETSALREPPTLIFDEVDTGIGGGVAETVGNLLRKLGQTRQVFTITHLPQVAAKAHNHYKVSKTTGKSSTSTDITLLTGKQRIDEIARMLGGEKITAQAKAHAKEMVEN